MTRTSERFGAFGVVPVALMVDPRTSGLHVAVYAALSSCLGYRSASGGAPLVRITERAGFATSTVRGGLLELEAWGFVDIYRRVGSPSRYRLAELEPASNAQQALPLEGLLDDDPAGSRRGVRREPAHLTENLSEKALGVNDKTDDEGEYVSFADWIMSLPPDEQRRVRRIVPRHLHAVDGG